MAKITRIEASKIVRPARKKVAAYARVSVNNEDTLHSLSTQISYYNELIQSNPEWDFAGIYYDEGITGTSTRNRRGFNEMIESCRKHEIDLLLVKSISRFARNTVDALNYTRELKSLGIDIFFERENIHTLSYEGELLLTLLASYAQEEALSISENVRWAVRKKYKKGEGDNHKAPYGYRWDGKKYITIPGQAETVKRIFRLYLNGESTVSISRKLYEEGIRGQKGGVIDDSSIRFMLSNPAYKGTLRLQKWYIADNKTKKANKGDLNSYEVDGVYEQLISPKDFDTVQKILKERSIKYKPKDTEKHILSGKCSCGVCGRAYVRKKRMDHLAVWMCNRRKTTYIKEAKPCDSSQIHEEELMELLSRALKTNDTDKMLRQIKSVVINKESVQIKAINGQYMEEVRKKTGRGRKKRNDNEG